VLCREVPRFKSVPKFQAIERDIAVLVDESVSHDALMTAIWSAPVAGVLRDALLFDIYRPKSATTADGQMTEKSMAVRLTLNATDDAALTESQIDATVAAVVSTLAERIGARQRT